MKKFEFSFMDKTLIDEALFERLFVWNKSQHEKAQRDEAQKIVNEAFRKAFSVATNDESIPQVQVRQKKHNDSLTNEQRYKRAAKDINFLYEQECFERYGAIPEIYFATFTEDIFTFNVEILKDRKRAKAGSRLEIQSDPWRIFKRHATFREILEDVNPDTLYDEDKLIEKQVQILKTDNISGILEFIRDNPTYLLDEEFAFRLSQILRTARWSKNKKEADRAINLLKTYLIPKRPGGRANFPEGLDIVREMMIELALHISQTCKNSTDLNIVRTPRQRLDNHDFITLKSWAQRNKEYRISFLSQDDLSTLIFQPITYVCDLMETHSKTALKTIHRRRASHRDN